MSDENEKKKASEPQPGMQKYIGDIIGYMERDLDKEVVMKRHNKTEEVFNNNTRQYLGGLSDCMRELKAKADMAHALLESFGKNPEQLVAVADTVKQNVKDISNKLDGFANPLSNSKPAD